jgi:hypothetical protein
MLKMLAHIVAESLPDIVVKTEKSWLVNCSAGKNREVFLFYSSKVSKSK